MRSGRLRVPEIRGADLDRARARDQKLGRVRAARDSAQADHRNLDRLRGFIHHPQRDRLDGGTGSPPNPAPMRGRRVCASMASATNVFTSEIASAPRFGRRARQRLDPRDVRRKLDDQRPSARDDAADGAATTSPSSAGSLEKKIPPCLVLGQETFSS